MARRDGAARPGAWRRPSRQRIPSTAALTLSRAGTFIYHTYLNDEEQLTSGLYGAILVLEPGDTFDSSRDHAVLVGWDGPRSRPTCW